MAPSIDIAKQTRQEIATMTKMVALYCRGKHRTLSQTQRRDSDGLCLECGELLDYALARIDRCPVKENKTFCSACTIHCYQSAKREQIRTVMRYSGPRMLWHDPVMAIRHLISTRRQKAS